MTSIDWWSVLVEDARKRGPDALKLVMTVGEDRAAALINAMAETAYARFLDGLPPKKSDGASLYEALEVDLRSVLKLRAGRFDFPSER